MSAILAAWAESVFSKEAGEDGSACVRSVGQLSGRRIKHSDILAGLDTRRLRMDEEQGEGKDGSDLPRPREHHCACDGSKDPNQGTSGAPPAP